MAVIRSSITLQHMCITTLEKEGSEEAFVHVIHDCKFQDMWKCSNALCTCAITDDDNAQKTRECSLSIVVRAPLQNVSGVDLSRVRI